MLFLRSQRVSAAILALTFVCASPAFAADRYYVPPTQFNAAFQVMDRGFSNIIGLFQNATGAFSYDPAAKTIANVKIALDAGSLSVPNRGASRDLNALFDSDNNPEISFMATTPAEVKDNKAEIKGTLKIKGQSKPAVFEGVINNIGRAKQASTIGTRESDAIGLSLKGTFKRADFAMGDEPEMPGRFGETITLMLEMQAIKQ